MIQAYSVENGQVGIRRWRLALPSVVCSTQAAKRAVESVVRGKTVEHPLGCAQVGSDKEQTRNTLIGIGAHPNVERVVVVGLGCEGGPAQEVAEGIRQRGRSTQAILIQATGGMQKTEAKVREALEAPEPSAQRITVGMDRLVIGLASWEAMGGPGQHLVDALRQAGARLIWAVPEGHEGPGQALAYAEPLDEGSHEGWMPAIGGEAASLTGLVAGGCHLVLALGDLQHLGGHPIAPVIRLGVDPALRSILTDDLDGWIDDRRPEQWLDYVEAVCNGTEAVSEQFGGDMFAIARLGPTL
ncbi:MAG: UxaA family hydrolase [Firmicutes bacterium]|jgi:altronate dehydratase|nr:UxaA family hydrolase [Bacillota bacterium]